MVRGFKTIRPIGLQLNLPRKTVSNIVDRFVRTGSVQPGVGGNEQDTNSKSGRCCLVHGVLQTSKAKCVCCGSTKYNYLELRCLIISPVQLRELCLFPLDLEL